MQTLNKNPAKTGRKGETLPVGALAAKGLLRVMEELRGVLSQEHGLVQDRKHDEHAALLKLKQRLTVDYRAGMKSVIAEPEMFKDLPEDMRKELRLSAQKLSEATDSNAKMLRSAVVATQRLIQNIVSIIKKEALTKPGYTDHRTSHMALGNYSPVCKPVAVSQTA